MTYLQKTRPPKARKWLKIAITILVLLVIMQIFFPSVLGGIFARVFYPIWKGNNALARTVNFTGSFIKSRASLISENSVLKEKLLLSDIAVLERDKLKSENEDIKKLLGREDKKVEIIAAVLARPPQAAYDTLVIDLGANHSLVPGSHVFGQGDVALGVIAEVYAKTSKARLFSAPGEKTVVVIDRTNTSLEAAGLGGGDFEIQAPRDADIQVGDILVSSGIDRPVVGRVVQVEENPKESFKKVLAKTPLNVSELEWVTVDKK